MKNILWKIGHDQKIETISHASGCALFDCDKQLIDDFPDTLDTIISEVA